MRWMNSAWALTEILAAQSEPSLPPKTLQTWSASLRGHLDRVRALQLQIHPKP
jgi:hypothetical protein